MQQLTNFAPIFGIAGLATAFLIYGYIKKQPDGNERMKEIAGMIHEGAMVYLRRQYTILFAFIAIVFIALSLFINVQTGIAYVGGAISSMLAGFFGMKAATKANVRTAQAANLYKPDTAKSLSIAFLGGSVMGLSVASIGLVGLGIFFLLYGKPETAAIINGYAMGASSIALFARVGGGIYTKTADVGSDLVGKVEAGIPEDDPRNPGVIADNVGDNVGDCAGMAADLFETYAVTLTGALTLTGGQLAFPLVLGGLAIIASIVGGLFAKLGKNKSIMGALYKSLIAALIISAGLFYWASSVYFPENTLNIFFATVVGLVVTILMVIVTDYYTAKNYRPVKSIAEASRSGHGTNIIMGLSVGMEATFVPIIVIGAGILGAFALAGIYG